MRTVCQLRGNLGKRLFRGAVVSVILLLFLLLLPLFHRCPLVSFWGIPCPGCGMTRAFQSLLRLDFRTAFSYHPLWPLVAGLYFWVLGCYLAGRWDLAKDRRLWWAVATLFLLFWGIRLWFFFTGNSPFSFEEQSVLGKILRVVHEKGTDFLQRMGRSCIINETG